MKTLLLSLFLASTFLSNAQTQQAGPDSISFAKLKAEFVQFEKDHAHYIQTNNVNMHYLTWGNTRGKPLVWVHGTYSNAYEFFPFADSLVKRGYYVIAIDYYGHGFTPIPEKEVSLYSVADDIKLLLDRLKIKQAVVGGWSRGGCVATAFYDAYRDKVSGLILEDGGSVAAATTDSRLSIDSFSVKAKNNIESAVKLLGQEFESEFDAVKNTVGFNNKGDVFWALSAFKKSSAGKYSINPQIAKLIGISTVQEYLTLFYRPFASNNLFATSYQILSPKIIYRNLHVPMLILDPVSAQDEFKVEAENAALQKAHPELIVHRVYKDTSHSLKGQRADEFLKDLNLFLSGLENKKLK